MEYFILGIGLGIIFVNTIYIRDSLSSLDKKINRLIAILEQRQKSI